MLHFPECIVFNHVLHSVPNFSANWDCTECWSALSTTTYHLKLKTEVQEMLYTSDDTDRITAYREWGKSEYWCLKSYQPILRILCDKQKYLCQLVCKLYSTMVKIMKCEYTFLFLTIKTLFRWFIAIYISFLRCLCIGTRGVTHPHICRNIWTNWLISDRINTSLLLYWPSGFETVINPQKVHCKLWLVHHSKWSRQLNAASQNVAGETANSSCDAV